MTKKRILFLIHDLGPGGAEKVLVNLVNGMNRDRFDVSLRTLFDWGPNRQALASDVSYSAWMPRDIPGNSHWMKLRSPEQLWRRVIPGTYDIVVSFLEGPCARVTGGCPKDGPRIVDWIHTPILSEDKFIEGFRGRAEAERCYSRADALVFVSEDVREAFTARWTPTQRTAVLHNVFESDRIRMLAEEIPEAPMEPGQLNWCGMGKLVPLKGWNRMLKIQQRLRQEGYPAHFWLIGDGPQRKELEHLADELGISDSVTFTGYQLNPYAILSRCMLYVCASEREGFSTSAVESLLVGTPVCTVDIGGMREILGNNGEYGVITGTDDESLAAGVHKFFADPEYRNKYKMRAIERGLIFDKNASIAAIENYLCSIE